MPYSYYCDDCGHVFSKPALALHISRDPGHRECPKCGCRDFEGLQTREDVSIDMEVETILQTETYPA